jgi:CTP:molybdopterin cytidylyltransferase MocA
MVIRIVGLVLAAGAGSRFGGPKAFAVGADGTPWVASVVDALAGGGCDARVVVLSPEAARARTLVPAGARSILAPDAHQGLSASLATGLEYVASAAQVDAAVIVPVDVPGMPAAAVARIIEAARDPDGTGDGEVPRVARSALVRAVYRGRPGHPVLIGVDHIPALVAGLAGDAGAGPYLSAHAAREVECTDLWSGEDIDRPLV